MQSDCCWDGGYGYCGLTGGEGVGHFFWLPTVVLGGGGGEDSSGSCLEVSAFVSL